MYKLTLGSLNEIKYSDTDAHGLFSGTIETDRVVIVDGDGKYLQTDGNWGNDLKNGLVRTWSATLDSAEVALLKTKYSSKSADTAPVYVYDGLMALQSDYASVDAFIEYLVDEGVITIQGYSSPKYELSEVLVKSAGAGYTEDVTVSIAGESGDTAGSVECTVDTDAESETYGQILSAAVTSAGSYEKKVASQDVEVAGGTTKGVITVKMAAISE